jgi:ketosteroid isomerase-like protein
MVKKRASRATKRTSKAKAVKKRDGAHEAASAAIRRLDEEFMRAAAVGDGQALVDAFYAGDAVLLPPNQPAAEGRENIRRVLQGLMDSGVSSIKLETTVTGTAGDLAYGRGRYTLSMEPPGGAPVTDVGKYVVVYRRQGGAWRAVADIFNSDQPAGG